MLAHRGVHGIVIGKMEEKEEEIVKKRRKKKRKRKKEETTDVYVNMIVLRLMI